jgi:tetratricopeptide (TPR) repeat protein
MAKMVLRTGKVAIKIILPFVVLGLIFFSIKKLTPATAQTEPVQSESDGQIALIEDYREQGRYAEAEQMCQGIITQYPGSDGAFEAQIQLVFLYISWDRPAEADAALEELTSTFSENPGISKAVYDIAEWYREFDPIKAIEIFQYVLDNYPDSNDAIWSQLGVVQSNVALGNDMAAQAAYEDMLSNFSANEDISSAICGVAEAFCEFEKYGKALEIHQYVLTNLPEAEGALCSLAGIARVYIGLRDETSAQSAIERILAGYSEDKNISEAVICIANEYRYLNPQKALELYQYVLNNIPDGEDEIWAMSGLARSYIALGNDPNAQKVIDALLVQFSESAFIANAVCGIADGYCDAGEYEKALELYQYTLQTRQDCRSQDVILAGAGKISANIGLDNHATAETEIDELIAEFSNHPDFPETVSRIEEDYFDKVFLVKGLTEDDWLRPIWMWEKVLSADANFFYNDPDLYYFIAGCYYKIGEYGNALEYYEFTSLNWPDKKIGRDAQIMLDKVEQKLIMLAK